MSQMNAGTSETRAHRPAQQSAAMDAAWDISPPQPTTLPSMPVPRQRGGWSWLGDRLAGPGGYYNIGNAIGLLGGIALAIAAAGGETGPTLRTGAQAAFDHLAGSASALSITLAMLVFFWSGEAYHRAWAGGFPPDERLNRQGDLLSGYGALALGLGLFLIGQPLLAATAGLLHAFGKFGSAFWHPKADGPRRWPDPFRTAVLISRLPALVLVSTEFVVALSTTGVPVTSVAAPAMLIICYLLWAKADLLLFRS